MKVMMKDALRVELHDSRAEMGLAAGTAAAAKIRELLAEKDCVNVIFAAAPSQNEMLEALVAAPGIDWSRVNAFHMDEYVGLPAGAPQAFGNFLREHIFDRLPFGRVEYIDGHTQDGPAECARYAALLEEYPTDVVLMGIGENGHIAFNDPHVAFFDDPEAVKLVELDNVCRQQQVNDGCFAALEQVPTHAYTLTIPTLVRAPWLFCTVPAPTKAEAVKNTVLGPVSERCPASVLRTRPNAVLFCDPDSGRYLV